MKTKTVFYCTQCGNESAKWMGKCPACGSWNTLVEQPAAASASKTAYSSSRKVSLLKPKLLDDISAESEIRFTTGSSEFDRVLGGGAVVGSLVLVGGSPGIGKSTLMLQICGNLADETKVLYVTGEESERQLKLRAKRLGTEGKNLYVLAETDLGNILENTRELSPKVVIIDSIQTLYNAETTGSPGSISQVKDSTFALMQLAKYEGITVFVIGHVNKDGAIAGPKVLEHMVDSVLYFEGNESNSYRILRSAKNRFGSTNEIGVFEMEGSGLKEVENPSSIFISGRPLNTPGTCIACVMEGTRPVLTEIQALVTASSYNNPRRMTDGFDYNRAMLLLAILENRGGFEVGRCDAYINVVGGFKIDEPAADLPAIVALASSVRNIAVNSKTAVIGEVGLTGELRSSMNMTQRLSEIKRHGFEKVIIPRQGLSKVQVPEGLEIAAVSNISEAIKAAM